MPLFKKGGIVLLFFFTLSCHFSPAKVPSSDENIVQFCFDISCFVPKTINAIHQARNTIDIAMYGFENEEIADALIEAYKHRKIQIRLVTDYDSEGQEAYQKLIKENIPVVLGNNSGIMHNKYFIIDKKYIITGSTNLTKGMDKYFNNLIILRSPQLANEYQKDFDRLFIDRRFAAQKDDPGGSVTPWNNIYAIYPVGQYRIRVLFTPYKSFYPTTKYDDPETPTYNPNELNYSNAMSQIIPLLENAQKSIVVLAFSLTDRIVVDRLKKAYTERGVSVRVWMDRSQYLSSQSHSGPRIQSLAQTVKEVKICKKPNNGLLHHKVIIIDHQIVILGSLNFSVNAVESNDENFLIIENASSLADALMQEAARIDSYSDYLIKPEE